MSVEFAANEAAHDADQLYWPTLEKDTRYYNITSEHAPDSAFKIVKSALDYSGVNSYDSNITKIDKVLKYISAHVTYSTRLLDHMWFPSETLTFKSGDCTSFSILAASMLEASGVKCSIGFFRNSNGDGHAMVLIYLSDLGDLQYNYFEDLTAYSLKAGRWIIIEPQNSSVYNYSSDWISQWKLVAAS
jgi:transglutaminase-like putative cysteine protease